MEHLTQARRTVQNTVFIKCSTYHTTGKLCRTQWLLNGKPTIKRRTLQNTVFIKWETYQEHCRTQWLLNGTPNTKTKNSVEHSVYW